MTQKRLIEVTLPLKAISAQSAREKSIRHGHISTLHIWWARRPLAAMRAASFAALVPAPESDEEREELEALIATIVNWDQVKDGNSPNIERERARIRQAFPDGPPRLLDPFMGGGLRSSASGLRNARGGTQPRRAFDRTVHAGVPAAVWARGASSIENHVSRLPGMEDLPREGGNPLAEDMHYWGNWVLERARDEIGHVYENPEGDQTIVGYLWARTVVCPNPACRAEMPLARQWWLAKRKGRRIALKPAMDYATKTVTFEVVDMQRDAVGDFDPANGTSRRSHGTCLFCGQVADKSYVKAEGIAGRMSAMPLAVITEREGRGKAYRPFTEQDRALFAEAQAKLQALDPRGELSPGEAIPSGSSRAIFVYLYGLTRWRDLFNDRQLLALLTFSRQVRAAYEAMVAGGMDRGRAKAVRRMWD